LRTGLPASRSARKRWTSRATTNSSNAIADRADQVSAKRFSNSQTSGNPVSSWSCAIV
jgi:hypothetical protein